MSEFIMAAAIKYEDGVVSLPRPARHHNIIHNMFYVYGTRTKGDDEQGFVTNNGRFVDREEGCRIARAAGQIITKHGPDTMLFSEDMW